VDRLASPGFNLDHCNSTSSCLKFLTRARIRLRSGRYCNERHARMPASARTIIGKSRPGSDGRATGKPRARNLMRERHLRHSGRFEAIRTGATKRARAGCPPRCNPAGR
jgi:hypothetical protein